MKILLGMWLVSLYSVGIYQVTMAHGTGGPLRVTSFSLSLDTLLHGNTESELVIRPIGRWRQSFC